VSFDSGDLESDDSFDQSLDQAGEIRYFCTIHTYMEGTIIVE
jgi:plastocyanin